ncbi:MAG: IS1 family transposase [Candidatus Peribacteraceae bacterium]|nr:IS1 family transposase [Candidatus Peribacteraceae bacterium]
MNPQEQFCPNMSCSARGQIGQGNIGVHSQKDRRYRCRTCGRTFSETKGSALYGIKKCADLFVLVITLLSFGCPVQAIVMAFRLDERTVRSWWNKSGQHCKGVHENIIGNSQLDLEQVQLDEIKVKTQKGSMWMAMAEMVSTRLWLGGAVSAKRDKHLIRKLMTQVRVCALCRPLLIAVDGFSAYVDATRKAFRTPLRLGQQGRPHLITWENIAIVQVVKQRKNKVLSIERRIVQGCKTMIDTLIERTQGHGGINTAYIERLNATFRQRLACLARRSRALARTPQTLENGMFLLGCVYNFCSFHKSLRLPLYIGERRRRWVQRTPALAARLTDHQWTVEELLCFKVPPPSYVVPKKRGRPRKQPILEVIV